MAGKKAKMLIGHKKQLEFLRKSIENRRISQALLFAGEDSLGKKKAAFEFLKILNCRAEGESLKDKPCNLCQNCKLIEEGRHPDLLFIKPENRVIQISKIREAQAALSLGRQMAEYRGVVIDNAHLLNSQAQGALLKTLEEPAKNTVFILITSKPFMLLETIRSRCEVLKFYPLPYNEMEKSFKAAYNKYKAEEITSALFVARGRPGIAIKALADSQYLLREKAMFAEIGKIIGSGIFEKFSFVKSFLDKNKDAESINEFLDALTLCLRDLMQKKLKVYSNYPLVSFKEEVIEKFSFEKISQAVEFIEKIKFLISVFNVNKRLALENLMLEI